MKRLKLGWITIVVFLLDQATKLRVRNTMQLNESFSVIGDFFRITYVTNHGGGFSLNFGDGMFNYLLFLIAPIIATGLILILISKTEKTLPLVGYFLILGGALGNLTDRITCGHVTDFLDFDFFDFIIQRWPVFNIADSALTVAIIILIVDMLFLSGKKTEITEPISQQER